MIATVSAEERVREWIDRVLEGYETPQNGLYLCDVLARPVSVESIFFKTLPLEYLAQRIVEESRGKE